MRFVLYLIASISVGPALAHQAPSGWEYDAVCCHTNDCAPIPATAVRATPEGLHVRLPAGSHGRITIPAVDEIVPHGDGRIRASGDRDWHACIVGRRVRCLYRPPMGF